MITATIIVDTRTLSKNGYPLKIRVYDQIRPHRYIKLSIYQKEKSKVIYKNSYLKQREYQLSLEVDYCNKNGLNLEQSLEIIKKGIPELDDIDNKVMLLELELERLKKKRKTTTFKTFYDIFIQEKINEGLEIETKLTRLNKFMNYLKSIDRDIDSFYLNDIDYEVLQGYKIYCINNGLSINSTKSYFQDLNNFYKEAQKRKSLNVKLEDPFIGINIKAIKKASNRAIDLENFKEFISLKFYDTKKGSSFTKIKDLIKFQFLIGGHDFIELSHLKWTDIKDNRIKFTRFKNNHRGGGVLIDNMLHPLALEIINKYGTKESERIFSFIPIKTSNDYTYNKYLRNNIYNKLKSIKNKYNIDYSVQTKYIRYTFRTIAGNLMINQMIIEKIMGHSNHSISMGYQGATPYEIQDREHLKVINEVFDCKV